MKSKLYLILVVLLALFSESCTKENLQIQSRDLIGVWQTEKIEFIGTNLAHDFDSFNDGTLLDISEEEGYYKNYVIGQWKQKKQKLILDPDSVEGFERPKQVYKIISFTKDKMVLEIEMTDSEYCCDFEEFENDEKLIIREHYKRNN